MKSIFQKLLSRPTANTASLPLAKMAAEPKKRQSGASRWLASAIERAMARSMWSQASRIVKSAVKLAPHYPHLTEQIARYFFARGEFENAIETINSCHLRTSSLRLLEDLCLINAGKTAEARDDLVRWSKKATAPLTARVALALLVIKSGDQESARTLLAQNLRQMEDPMTLAVLISLCVAEGKTEQARQWADRLRATSAWIVNSVNYDLMLKALDLGIPAPAHVPSKTQIESLALELVANEEIIPVLVRSQCLQYDSRLARLLSEAIERSIPEVEKPHLAYESLAKLALAAENFASAHHWAHQGQDINPMSTTIAQLIQSIERPQSDSLHKLTDVLGTIGNPVTEIEGEPEGPREIAA